MVSLATVETVARVECHANFTLPAAHAAIGDDVLGAEVAMEVAASAVCGEPEFRLEAESGTRIAGGLAA